MATKPIIGISMGDPAGIGPEIIASAMARDGVDRLCRPIVVGNPAVIERAIGVIRSPLKVNAISKASGGRIPVPALARRRSGRSDAAPFNR